MIPQDFTRAGHDSRSGRIGIIDIGSNSVRLVVYDQLKRAPTPLYNEKVLCQLGKGLAISGNLNPDGVALARAAIARFLAMAKAMEVTEVDIVATAAVRDAADGEAFVEEIEQRHGIHIEVISGKREARLGAYGIMASVHHPDGVSGDLGGGSMELVRMEDHRVREQMTLPIGGLRLLDQSGGDRAKMRELVAKSLAEAGWLKERKIRNFYAIGGSFRAIAHMHMLGADYPLHIIHQYTLETKPFLSFIRSLARLPEADIAALPGAVPKRLASLPPAAIILEQMLEMAKPEQIVFSASGIREGYLYEKLSPYLREEDALLASCTEFALKGGRGTAYAHELFEWMEPLFPDEDAAQQRLRFASCLLHDIARYIHPEHRADWAIQRILQSSLTGLCHEERVQLAMAMYHRYQFKLKTDAPALSLIGPDDKARAKLIGSCMNLAYHLTGGIPGTLPQTRLEPGKSKLALSLPGALADLYGDSVKKRVSGVEEAWREQQK